MRFRRIAFILPAIILGGCILGVDSLTGGEGNSADSGSSENDSGTDASNPNDSSTTADSSKISPTDGGSEGGRFCPQTGAFLCDDFDDVDIDADVPGPWDFAYAPAGAVVSETTLISKSAPGSVEIGTSTGTVSILNKTVTGMHIDIAFDLFIQSNGSNSSILGFSIGSAILIVKPESPTQTTFLETDTLSDGGITYLGTGTATPVPTGQWTHIETVVDFPDHLAKLSIDGTLALQRALTGGGWISAKSANVSIGTANANDCTFYYDNVVIIAE